VLLCYFVFRRAVIDYRLIKALKQESILTGSVADFAQTLKFVVNFLLLIVVNCFSLGAKIQNIRMRI
jgi:hypothetical protein